MSEQNNKKDGFLERQVQKIKDGLKGKKRTRKGDFRRWHPARNPDGSTVSAAGEQVNSANITKNRNFSLSDYVWYNSSAQFTPSSIQRNLNSSPTATELVRNLKNADGVGIDVPKVIMKEFQPDFLFNWGDLIDQALGQLGELFSNIGSGSNTENSTTPTEGDTKARAAASFAGRLAGRVASGFEQLLPILGTGATAGARLQSQKHINELMAKIARDNSAFTKDVINEPVDLVRKMFSGEYLGSYELPYYGDVYLKAESIENWSRSGLSEQIGSKIGTFLKENMSLDVPTTPTWKNDDGGGTPPPLEFEFILYNKDIEALIANYRFIHALISGAYWAQLGYNQKSPNLYDVTIPGRLHYFYCAMDCEIEYLGKVRELSSEGGQRFKSAFKDLKINVPAGRRGRNRVIDSFASDYADVSKDSAMFPDGYQVKVTLQSLMPNSFNMYLHYLLNGSTEKGEVERDLLQTIGRTATTFGRTITGGDRN